MRKNGFTLIELLAVIVILAIIALIATPIILGIINDAREESNERSVELYASAVRNGIAAYQLREMKEVAAGTYTSETLPFDVEYDGEVECTTIDIYEDGGVYVAGCTVNGNAVDYTYGTKQVVKGTIGICNPLNVQTEGVYTAGDKYECDVDPNKEGYEQIFYVLTNATSGSVNLIMDSNINISGEAVKTGVTDKGLVAWINQSDYIAVGGSDWSNDGGQCQYGGMCASNEYGPITTMNYLQEATKKWTNVNPQTVSTFTDYAGETHNMAKIYIVNARIPYISEAEAIGCYGDLSETCPLWMVDYLSNDYEIAGRNGVSGVLGYWTLTSTSSDHAWYIEYGGSGGYAFDSSVDYDGSYGVRPVINLSI